MHRTLIALTLLALCACTTTTPTNPLLNAELVDLTYAFDEHTL